MVARGSDVQKRMLELPGLEIVDRLDTRARSNPRSMVGPLVFISCLVLFSLRCECVSVHAPRQAGEAFYRPNQTIRVHKLQMLVRGKH